MDDKKLYFTMFLTMGIITLVSIIALTIVAVASGHEGGKEGRKSFGMMDKEHPNGRMGMTPQGKEMNSHGGRMMHGEAGDQDPSCQADSDCACPGNATVSCLEGTCVCNP